jgi:hypothetical protein
LLGTSWFGAVAAEAGPGKTVAIVGDVQSRTIEVRRLARIAHTQVLSPGQASAVVQPLPAPEQWDGRGVWIGSLPATRQRVEPFALRARTAP